MENHIKFDNTLIQCEYFISCEVRRLYQLPMIQQGLRCQYTRERGK